jgi:hypothetical protein
MVSPLSTNGHVTGVVLALDEASAPAWQSAAED